MSGERGEFARVHLQGATNALSALALTSLISFGAFEEAQYQDVQIVTTQSNADKGIETNE